VRFCTYMFAPPPLSSKLLFDSRLWILYSYA
jgi:hypothetical protein